MGKFNWWNDRFFTWRTIWNAFRILNRWKNVKIKSGGGFRSFAQPQQIFALSLIVLSAKLSKADGQVSREELIAVKDKLKIPDSELDQVGKIFNKAKKKVQVTSHTQDKLQRYIKAT